MSKLCHEIKLKLIIRALDRGHLPGSGGAVQIQLLSRMQQGFGCWRPCDVSLQFFQQIPRFIYSQALYSSAIID